MLEVVIATTITATIFSLTLGVVVSTQSNTAESAARLDREGRARDLATRLVDELRNTSAHPDHLGQPVPFQGLTPTPTRPFVFRQVTGIDAEGSTTYSGERAIYLDTTGRVQLQLEGGARVLLADGVQDLRLSWDTRTESPTLTIEVEVGATPSSTARLTCVLRNR